MAPHCHRIAACVALLHQRQWRSACDELPWAAVQCSAPRAPCCSASAALRPLGTSPSACLSLRLRRAPVVWWSLLTCHDGDACEQHQQSNGAAHGCEGKHEEKNEFQSAITVRRQEKTKGEKKSGRLQRLRQRLGSVLDFRQLKSKSPQTAGISSKLCSWLNEHGKTNCKYKLNLFVETQTYFIQNVLRRVSANSFGENVLNIYYASTIDPLF